MNGAGDLENVLPRPLLATRAKFHTVYKATFSRLLARSIGAPRRRSRREGDGAGNMNGSWEIAKYAE